MSRFVFSIATLITLCTVAHAGEHRQQPGGRNQDRIQSRRQQPPKRFKPGVIYTMRPAAKVTHDVTSWGVQVDTKTFVKDPTRLRVNGLPRGASAWLQVQDRSKAINLSFAAKHQTAQNKSTSGWTLGALKQRLGKAHQLRTVWQTKNAQPKIDTGELAEKWERPDKILPVNQPYQLKWIPSSKASGPERRTLRGQVQGLKHDVAIRWIKHSGHDTSITTTTSGQLAPKWEGFIQRKNLLKTDAYRGRDRQAYVKVKGLRALPNDASFTVRNLQTGETVSGKATRYGSFNARVPVVANAEQQLELTIRLQDKTGIETTVTRSLGRVTFADHRRSGKQIAYHYVKPAGRGLPTISANVKGATVNLPDRRPLPRPTVTLGHNLLSGQAEPGSGGMNFVKARNQTALSIGHISAGSTVEVQQQVAPTQGKGKPTWKSLGQTTVQTAAQGANRMHQVTLDGGIYGHTPVKVLIRRPGQRKTHVTYLSMPKPGEMPIANYYSAESLYRSTYGNWTRPEALRRTVAYAGADGTAEVRVHGKLVAPATARVAIVNTTTNKESRAKYARESLTTTVKAKPGHKLALKVTFADGKVESKPLGIVPDSVESTYRPTTGLRYFSFTKNHIR